MSEQATESATIPAERSVAGGALLKLTAEVAALVLSFVTGVVTARNLGPIGKGDLATMGYIMVLLASTAGLGLGEAGVTLTVRGRPLRDVVRAVSLALALSSTVGMLVLLGIGWALFHERWDDLLKPLALTAAAVPPLAAMLVLGSLLDARRDFVVTASSRVAASFVTAGATVVAIVVLDKSITGAAAAALVGWGVGAAIVIGRHVQVGTLGVPRFDRSILGAALRIGVPIQVAQLLMMATIRLDVVFVYALSGRGDAGRYSVAVTMGALNTFVPLSLASAAYPRLAGLQGAEFGAYAARLCRVAVIAAVVSGVLVGITLPVVIPGAFGEGFEGSVLPSALLLLGSVFWSAQWMACRAMASIGETAPLVRSFGANLVAMVALDLLLVPAHGPDGAALASVLATAVGAGVALASLRSRTPLRAVVPRFADVRDVTETMRWLRATFSGRRTD